MYNEVETFIRVFFFFFFLFYSRFKLGFKSQICSVVSNSWTPLYLCVCFTKLWLVIVQERGPVDSTPLGLSR